MGYGDPSRACTELELEIIMTPHELQLTSTISSASFITTTTMTIVGRSAMAVAHLSILFYASYAQHIEKNVRYTDKI